MSNEVPRDWQNMKVMTVLTCGACHGRGWPAGYPREKCVWCGGTGRQFGEPLSLSELIERIESRLVYPHKEKL